MEYMAYGMETCPTTQRIHWQGFLRFKKPYSIKAAIVVMKPHHIEIMKGTFRQNEVYCSKEGVLQEHGKKPQAGGKDEDIKQIVANIRSGKIDANDALFSNPNHVRYLRVFERAEEDWERLQRRNFVTQIVWITGPTGSGKSRYVHENCKDNIYIKPLADGDVKWWDSYNCQEEVWMDDFRGQIQYAELLTLADRYPKTVSRRCRAPKPFMAKKIYITSVLLPGEVYCKQIEKKDSIEQLLRRTEIYIIKDGQLSPYVDLSGEIFNEMPALEAWP